MSLSRLFTNNYEYLSTVARRITRCKDVAMAPDLISETYLNLSEKQTEYPGTDEEFVKWFSKCMKNYFVWPNSSFNVLYNSKETLTLDQGEKHYNSNAQLHLDTGYVNSYIELITDEDALNNIEIQVEGTNDFTKELIDISSCLGKIKTLKYIELVEFKRTLPPYESILFELYFEKELSTRDIARIYSDEIHKMNYQSVNKMVNSIKNKIKTYKWKS